MRIQLNFIFAFQSIVFGSNKYNKYRRHPQEDRTHLQVLTYYRVQRVSEGGIFAFLVMQFWVVQTKLLELVIVLTRAVPALQYHFLLFYFLSWASCLQLYNFSVVLLRNCGSVLWF